MRSYRDIGVVAPRAYVRVMDLYTGENISLVYNPETPTKDTLLTATVSRSMGNSGSANFVFANPDGVWSAPELQKVIPIGDNGLRLGEVGRLDVWDMMMKQPWSVKETKDRASAEQKIYLRTRPFPDLSAGALSGDTAEFFHAIFSGDPVMREANTERSRRYGEFLQRLKEGGIPATSADLQAYYQAALYVSIRTRIEVDFTDFRGYVFPAFTGYVASVSEFEAPNDLATVSVTCKDWMELWKNTLIASRQGYLLTQTLQSEKASRAFQTSDKMPFESIVSRMTPDQVMGELADLTDSTNTLEGFLELAVGPSGKSVGRVRDRVLPALWTTSQPVQIKGSEEAPIKPKFVLKERLWTKAVPYVAGPIPFDSAPSTVPPTGFRKGRGVFFDGSFSSDFRKFAPLAMQTLLRQSYETFQTNSTHPYEMFSPVVQRTFADFFCSASGDLVFKLPYLNHLPSPESCWDIPQGSSPARVIDSGLGQSQLPDGFHGNEYILSAFGREGVERSVTEEDKFSRIKGSFGMHYEKAGSVGSWRAVLSDAIQIVPAELQAFFGQREFEVSNALTTITNESVRWYLGSLLPMLNWKSNTISAEYRCVKHWELGKTIYYPERNWLYRLQGISYSYTKGQSFTAKLTGDYGHPALSLIPIPWILLYDGQVSDYNPQGVADSIAKRTAGMSAPWVPMYRSVSKAIGDKFRATPALTGEFFVASEEKAKIEHTQFQIDHPMTPQKEGPLGDPSLGEMLAP